MKKFLFFAAIAAIGLSSCTKDTSLVDPDSTVEEAINFGLFVGNTTKAVTSTIDSLKGDGFTAYAYYTGANAWDVREEADTFMFNQAVNFTATNPAVPFTGTWSYSPLKYWPNKVGEDESGADINGKVSFFGFSPQSSQIAITNFTPPSATATNVDPITGTNPSFKFENGETAADQVDLLADMQVDKSKDTGAIKFEFDHILSKIGFTARLNKQYAAGTVITVDSLKVIYAADKIYKSGTYTFQDDEGVAGTGDVSGAAGDWTFAMGDTFMANKVGFEHMLSENIMGARGAGYTVATLDNTADYNTKPVMLNKEDGYLMVIPQTLADSADLSVMITYTATIPGRPVTTSHKLIGIKASTWLIGKQYLYNFTVGLTEVTFVGISVDEWDDVTATTDNPVTPPAPVPYKDI